MSFTSFSPSSSSSSPARRRPSSSQVPVERQRHPPPAPPPPAVVAVRLPRSPRAPPQSRRRHRVRARSRAAARVAVAVAVAVRRVVVFSRRQLDAQRCRRLEHGRADRSQMASPARARSPTACTRPRASVVSAPFASRRIPLTAASMTTTRARIERTNVCTPGPEKSSPNEPTGARSVRPRRARAASPGRSARRRRRSSAATRAREVG